MLLSVVQHSRKVNENVSSRLTSLPSPLMKNYAAEKKGYDGLRVLLVGGVGAKLTRQRNKAGKQKKSRPDRKSVV